MNSYLGWWGNFGGLPQKGIASYTLAGNQQKPTAGIWHAAIFNSWRRFKGNVLYVVPPFVAYYFIMDWAEKRCVIVIWDAGVFQDGSTDEMATGTTSSTARRAASSTASRRSKRGKAVAFFLGCVRFDPGAWRPESCLLRLERGGSLRIDNISSLTFPQISLPFYVIFAARDSA